MRRRDPAVRAETANGSGSEAKTEGETKVPGKDRPFTIVVMGDSLADGLWASLYRSYIRVQKQVAVKRHAVNSAGFTAHSFESDFEKLSAELGMESGGKELKERYLATTNTVRKIYDRYFK